MVKGQYNFTISGLRHAEQHGITPVEVFEVVDSSSRVVKREGTQSLLMLGRTADARYLIILVTESDLEPDVWDVVAAREMWDEEITAYWKVRGGSHE